MRDVDVVVVGVGPSGLAAAVAAAERGLSVLLVDAGRRPGGQYWRHAGASGSGDPVGGLPLGSRFRDLRKRLRQCEARGGVHRIHQHQVWFVEALEVGFRVHLTPVGDHVVDTRPEIVARALVCCPGGHDRHLPVPGWDLPGVMAAGGVQALLKEHRVLAGRRAVVAGTGPFLLPVATGLAAAGADVVAVCEANDPTGWLHTPVRAAALPSKAIEAIRYAARLARHRIPYRTRTAVTAVRGGEEVRSVTVGRLDRRGRRTAEPGTDLDVDLVAFGWGFTPSIELFTTIGADTVVDTDESLVVEVDRWQRTSVLGAYAAGEATGVGGALLALAEGELAGLAAASDLGRGSSTARARRLQASIARGRAFARAMHRAHPVPSGWQEWVDDQTVLCRCEEVTIGEIRSVRTDLGATDTRTMKLLARPGMGWCQGRMCGFATAKLAAGPCGKPSHADLASVARRALAAPVPLGALAQVPDPVENSSYDQDRR